MIGTALAIGSGLASMYGSLRSGQSNDLVDRTLQKRKTDLQAWFDTEYNANYLDTPEARSAITVMRNNMQEQMKKADQGNVIRGASDERAVATAESGQKNLANSVLRLTGYGTQRKDAIGREMRMREMGLDNLVMQNQMNKSQQWTNFMNNAMNLGIGAAQAEGMGALDNADQKLAGLFKKRPGDPYATGFNTSPGYKTAR